MLRSIVFCALLCSIVNQVVGKPTVENQTIFSRVIETRLPNPITIVMGSDLYTISKTNKSLSINSTDATCKLANDPFDENIEGRINAMAFESNRKIIVWGIQKSQLNGGIRRTYYTLLIVNPISCNYKVVPLPIDKVSSSWPLLQPQVTLSPLNGNDNSFYLFYPTQQTCSPCSYEFNGEETFTIGELEPHGGLPTGKFLIKDYESNKYSNIFCAFNFDNGTALIKLLDNELFESGWHGFLSTTVDAASVSYGSYQNTAICSITPGKDRREVECARLTSRLGIGMSWILPLKDDLPVSDVSIEVDQLGNTFIGVINSQKLRFFIYNVDGQLAADLDFGKLEEKYIHRDVNGIRVGNEFCLVAVVYSDSNAQNTHHVVKCVDVTKYI